MDGSRTARPVRAYIGSFTSAGGRGITTASVDPATGALSELHTLDTVPDPSFLALAPGTRTLYAVSETPHGAVVALGLGDGSGRPEPLGAAAPVHGDGPTHLALAEGHLLTANYGSGGVSVLPVRADGTLGEPSHVLRHEGRGPVLERQAEPHAHAVLPDPSGRWVLSVDLGTDSVRVCSLDRAAGTLAPHREVRLRPGAGPRHLAFHPRGHRTYVINELDPTLTVCRWDAAAGELVPLNETPVVPGDAANGTYPSDVVIAPDGRYAWTANRGHDSISVLALGASGEEPELIGCVPCGGHWPRHLTLDPSGRRLYAAHERSGDVTWFDVDPATGLPHRAGALTVPAASCVVLG
ncbi:lactonase family protein [Streptomyces sp. 8N706]|uniref:lactonase family protein n=1 Tax=Streptomyces sp. 8N706 TaxID=3457416 RepID=UPI003FD508F7